MNDNRRRLTEEEVECIKQQLLDSIYKDIRKSFVRKILWVCGAVGTAALAWLNWPGLHK